MVALAEGKQVHVHLPAFTNSSGEPSRTCLSPHIKCRLSPSLGLREPAAPTHFHSVGGLFHMYVEGTREGESPSLVAGFKIPDPLLH